MDKNIISKSVALLGYYGKNNYGDDLMQDIISERLMKSECTINVYGQNDQHKINEIISHDIIVIGGGGIIVPNFWAFNPQLINEIINQNKKIYFLNVNITQEIFYDKNFLLTLKNLNSEWWVRDHESIEYLNKINIQSKYLPDIAWTINKNNNQVNKKKQLIMFPNYFALSKLWSDQTTESLKMHTAIKEIAMFMDWMTNWGWHIKLMAAQSDHEIDDRSMCAMIFSAMKKKHCAEWQKQHMYWNCIWNEIASSQLVVSMRYHTTISALANSVPCIDITHHDKNSVFLQENNLQSHSVGIDCIDQKLLINAVSYAENNYNFTKLYKQNNELWENFDAEWQSLI